MCTTRTSKRSAFYLDPWGKIVEAEGVTHLEDSEGAITLPGPNGEALVFRRVKELEQ